jgi:uncharacterized protein YdcH (DUF465 family)
MGEGDGLGWRAALPADLQGNETLTSFKEVKDLGAGYLDLTTKHTELGKKVTDYEGKLKDALFIPGDKATDEERASFYTKLGRPEAPDKYELTRPKLPDGMQYDEEGEKWFREQAHKLGLSKAQAAQIFEGYNARMDGIVKDIEAKRTKAAQEGVETLKKEWGPEFEANLNLVKRATEAFLTPDDKKFMDESGLGNHPVLVKLFQRMGKALAEDKFVAGRITKTTPTGAFDYPSMKE